MRRSKIEIDLRMPEEALNDKVYKQFLKNMEEFKYKPIEDILKYEINYITHTFETYLREQYKEYPQDQLRCRIRGELGYYETTWTLKELCNVYDKYCHGRYIQKEKYTRREINNMLFDLKLEDVIGGYKPVAVPICGANEDIYEGTITVCRRYFI